MVGSARAHKAASRNTWHRAHAKIFQRYEVFCVGRCESEIVCTYVVAIQCQQHHKINSSLTYTSTGIKDRRR